MSCPKTWRTVEIEQQCRFGWTLSGCKSFLDGWSVVQDYAYILHDKCTKSDGSPKEPHVHCMIRFNTVVPTSAILARAKSVFGKDDVVTVSNLEKCKSWKSAIAYLTHSNALDKFRYDDADVISNYAWQSDRDDALNPIKDKRLNELISLIDSEKCRRYNYMEFISAQEYVRYKRSIDDAFKYVNDRNISKGAFKNMEVLYLVGASGSGKTTYAKQFAEDHNLSYYVSSGSNDVLDGYGGQDVLILDDLRPSCMGLSDLLKLLDNNTSSTVKSRYINKSICYCKYIIITTTLDIDDFFSNVFEHENEPREQLKRRCRTLLKFDAKHIKTYTYDNASKSYKLIACLPNLVVAQFSNTPMTEERALSLIEDLFKGLQDASKYVVSNEQRLKDEFVDSPDNPFVN